MINIEKFELIVNEKNRNKFGEVFTDINLIAEMLKNNDSWEDLNKTYYDPCCGYGYFLFFVYDILMGNGFKYKGYENVIGLKNHIKDESEREKHIIEKMLFGTDIQQSSIDKCNELFKSDIYQTNFKCVNFMEYKTSIKFDNIYGNPPFEDFLNDKRKAKNHNLWRPIILKSFSLLKENGNMAFICPQSWMSFSKSNKDMFSIFNDNDILSLNIDECKKYFKGVGSSFSFFFLKRNKTNNFLTNIVCSYKKNSYNTIANLGKNNFFPLLLTKDTLSIINKTILLKDKKFSLYFDSYLHAYTKKKFLSKEKDSVFKYKIWHTPSIVLWSSIEHKTQNEYKVLIPITTYYEKLLVDKSGNTQGMGYIICTSKEEAERVKYILSLKLYRFIVNITRWSNWNSPDILRNLPLVDITKDWDDQALFDKFNLSNDEISLINDYFK